MKDISTFVTNSRYIDMYTHGNHVMALVDVIY